MTTIGLLVHPSKAEAHRASADLRRLAESKGLKVVDVTDRAWEVVVALGGDGTILRAARLAHDAEVPLLGINVGRLGFLSTIDASRLEAALDALATKTYAIEKRMMLEGTFGSHGSAVALNEFVIEKAVPSRVIEIRVSVDSDVIATYTADGFIVATPTGSTAYSLSAGGPVLEPSLDAIVLTPVSAHSPLWRSIVVEPERTVNLSVVDGAAALSADGQPLASFQSGEAVKIRRHERPLWLVNLEAPPEKPGRVLAASPRFFRKLRMRFHLDHEDPRAGR